MPFVPHTEADIRSMLDTIGVSSIDELFSSIPSGIRLSEPTDIPSAASEQETFNELFTLAEQNMPITGEISFLGGGPMRMYRPAVLQTILSRSEFITSYTPYQAEMSQGLLQAIFGNLLSPNLYFPRSWLGGIVDLSDRVFQFRPGRTDFNAFTLGGFRRGVIEIVYCQTFQN